MQHKDIARCEKEAATFVRKHFGRWKDDRKPITQAQMEATFYAGAAWGLGYARDALTASLPAPAVKDNDT